MGSHGRCLSRRDSWSKVGFRKANVVQEGRKKKSGNGCSVRVKGSRGVAWIGGK